MKQEKLQTLKETYFKLHPHKMKILLSNIQELQELIVNFRSPPLKVYITFSLGFDFEVSVEW